MKKYICLFLMIALLLSTLSTFAFAGDYSVKSINAEAPTMDGKITAGEYKDAAVIKIKPADLLYYAVNAADTWYKAFTPSAIEARGSKTLGDSTIYVLPTEDGVYFAFDIADTTYGSNYVKDVQWHDGMFNGEAVHVTFKKNANAVTDKTFENGDAVRFSVAPFRNDYNALVTSKRTINCISAITNNAKNGSYSIVETTGVLQEAVSWDESGYIVEFCIDWSDLETTYSGLSEYTEGGKLYLNFQITDALGATKGGSLNGETDWGIFQLPINSKFVESGKTVVNNDPGVLILDGKNWCSFEANSGEVITLTSKTDSTDTSETDDPAKETITYKYNLYSGDEFFAISLGEISGDKVSAFAIDGKTLSSDEYTIDGDKLMIKAAFLDNLGAGKYDAKISYTDNNGATSQDIIIKVVDFNNPVDFDGGITGIIIILLASSIGLTYVLLKKKKYN